MNTFRIILSVCSESFWTSLHIKKDAFRATFLGSSDELQRAVTTNNNCVLGCDKFAPCPMRFASCDVGLMSKTRGWLFFLSSFCQRVKQRQTSFCHMMIEVVVVLLCYVLWCQNVCKWGLFSLILPLASSGEVLQLTSSNQRVSKPYFVASST